MNIPLPRAKAIRLKCIDCSGGDKNEVRLCCLTKCPLWGWRMGEQPTSARTVEANKAAKIATPTLEAPYVDCYGQDRTLAVENQNLGIERTLRQTNITAEQLRISK